MSAEGIKLARIDVGAGKGDWVKKRLGDIGDLPQIHVVKAGKFYAYDGDFNAEAFLPFLHRISEPIPVLESTEAVD